MAWHFFKQKPDAAAYVKNYFLVLGLLLLAAFLAILPYSFLWLYISGDVAVERAVASQIAGNFSLFGSGVSQDFTDYKLQLYSAAKPEIAAVGSSRVMQFRGAWFRQSFVNMGGAAGNLAVLRATLDAMLAVYRPRALIIGLDFWWFLPQWEADPTASAALTAGTYNYGLASLKKPWQWLLDGKISLSEFLAPVTGVFGQGFRADRYGIMAQQTSDGFGPDGSWYYTAEITGQKPAFDYRFHDTLQNVRLGIKAFYHANARQKGPSQTHLEVLAEIFCKLKSRGIQVFAFIAPVSEAVLAQMQPKDYPHLFNLRQALLDMGIDALDLSNPKVVGSNDCEFIDGFHGGEVTYARILRRLADHWPALLAYVNMEKVDKVILDWKDFAFAPDARLTNRPETDFLGLGCVKKNAAK